MKRKRRPSGQPRQISSDNNTPDTSGWRPREKASESLRISFLKRCIAGEEHLRRVLAQERDSTIDAFDSGKPFESAVREEITRLLPQRVWSDQERSLIGW